MSKKLFVLIFLLAFSIWPCRILAATSIGVGFGIPYGIFGFNVNYSISKKVDLTLGYGEFLFIKGSAKAIGIRYYPNSDQSSLRYSLIYGTNAFINEDDCTFCFDSSPYEGLNIGLGWSSESKGSGWDFDLILILTSGAEDRIDELQELGDPINDADIPSLSISFGYHWH